MLENLTCGRCLCELRPENVRRRDNSLESGLDDFPRRRRYHTEMEANSIPISFEELREQLYVVLQSDSPARFNEMLTPDASEFRVMSQKVGEFRTLVHQIGTCETCDLLLKVGN